MAESKADLKTGFWIGLGLIGALFVVGLVRFLLALAVKRG